MWSYIPIKYYTIHTTGLAGGLDCCRSPALLMLKTLALWRRMQVRLYAKS